MAKDKSKIDPIEQARRKLVRAQLAFEVAQEKHTQTRAQGKQEVEKARLRAARWSTKSAEKLERRARALARAEARLLAAESSPPLDPDVAVSEQGTAVDGANTALTGREAQALDALRTLFQGDAVRGADWRRATSMAETTFARARNGLVARGVVTLDGGPGRNARYSLVTVDEST